MSSRLFFAGVMTAVLVAGGLRAQQDRASKAEYLSAGPVNLKFQEGELRYLYVGDKEVIRRVYLAVRDGNWDTVAPEFASMDVRTEGDSFAIAMEARCRSKNVDYSWKGEIAGTSDGTITFKARGKPNRPMKGSHVGICVLYGAESLAGQEFEALDANNQPILRDRFTRSIAKDVVLARDFRQISYTTAERMKVDLITGDVGTAEPGMEDQRHFGDSSYKVFKWERAEDPNETQSCEMTLQISGAGGRAARRGAANVRVGEVIADSNMPEVKAIERMRKSPAFLDISKDQKKIANTAHLTMGYSPPWNLSDEDTLMENIPAILDQLNAIRMFAPKAAISVAPINFDSPYSRPGPDPRGGSQFASAWAVLVTKYLAMARAEEATFTVATDFIEQLAEYSGRALREVTVETTGFEPVDALAIDVEGKAVVWLVNKTGEKQIVTFEGGERIGLSPFEVRKIEADDRE